MWRRNKMKKISEKISDLKLELNQKQEFIKDDLDIQEHLNEFTWGDFSEKELKETLELLAKSKPEIKAPTEFKRWLKNRLDSIIELKQWGRKTKVGYFRLLTTIFSWALAMFWLFYFLWDSLFIWEDWADKFIKQNQVSEDGQWSGTENRSGEGTWVLENENWDGEEDITEDVQAPSQKITNDDINDWVRSNPYVAPVNNQSPQADDTTDSWDNGVESLDSQWEVVGENPASVTTDSTDNQDTLNQPKKSIYSAEATTTMGTTTDNQDSWEDIGVEESPLDTTEPDTTVETTDWIPQTINQVDPKLSEFRAYCNTLWWVFSWEICTLNGKSCNIADFTIWACPSKIENNEDTSVDPELQSILDNLSD